MIEKLWITNPADDTLELDMRTSEATHGILIFNMTGLGSPKATVSGVSGPNVDGVRGTVVKTDARHIVLTLAVTARGDAEEVAKDKIYDYFPVRKTVDFRVTTGSRDVGGEAIVESLEFNQLAKVENAVIGLYFPDPWFYDIVQTNIAQAFPPHWTPKVITNDGDVETGFLLELEAFGGHAFSELIITNDRGSQEMRINVIYSNGDGDILRIDSRLGQKSIIVDTGSTQTDMLQEMDLTSDWLVLYPGDNIIEVSIGDPDDAPQYDPRDIGLLDYWPMNEVSGDAIGVHAGMSLVEYGGTIGSAPGWGMGGFYDIAREFVPADTAIFATPGAESVLNPMGDFTFGFWVYLDALPSTNEYWSIAGANFDSGDDGGWEVRINDGGYVEFRILKDGVWTSHTHGLTPSTGTWMGNLYCCSYDWSAGRAYIAKGTDVSTYTSAPNPDAYWFWIVLSGRPAFWSFHV